MFLLKNTYFKKDYILDTLWYAVALVCAFYNVCFIPLPSLTVFASRCVLFALVLVITPICTALTLNRGRNGISLWINSLLPLEIYAAIAFMPYYKIEITLILWAIVIISILFTVTMLLCAELKLSLRIKASGAGVRATAAICLIMLILPISVRGIFGHGFLLDRTKVVNGYSNASEWTVENKSDTLALLNEENWKTLDAKGKMAVLATVKNIEIRHLGINHDIHIEVDSLGDEVWGDYNPTLRILRIDIKHLESDSAAECLSTVLHECYHAYQYMQASLYASLPEKYLNMMMFDDAKRYTKELPNYINGVDDLGGYYAQDIEIKADNYAFERANAYTERGKV